MNKRKPKIKYANRSITSNKRRKKSVVEQRLHYKFLVLMGVLILACISIVFHVETPVVWTFLYGIGGWAALTTNPGSPLR